MEGRGLCLDAAIAFFALDFHLFKWWSCEVASDFWMLQKMCVFIMFLIDFRLALRFLLLFTLEPVDGQEFVSDLQQLLKEKNLWASKTHWRFRSECPGTFKRNTEIRDRKKKTFRLTVASLGETQVSTLLSAWRKAEQWRWKSDPSPRMPVESQGEPESPYSLFSINTYLSIYYILKMTASAKGHCYGWGNHTRIISRWVHVWSPIPTMNCTIYMCIYVYTHNYSQLDSYWNTRCQAQSVSKNKHHCGTRIHLNP